jgi:hypothetical protein
MLALNSPVFSGRTFDLVASGINRGVSGLGACACACERVCSRRVPSCSAVLQHRGAQHSCRAVLNVPGCCLPAADPGQLRPARDLQRHRGSGSRGRLQGAASEAGLIVEPEA